MPAIITAPFGSFGLTGEEIATRVKRIFGDESGVEIEDADILRWINDGQLDIARRTSCIHRVTELGAIAGVTQYAIPFDFLFFKRATYNGRLLSSIPFQTLDKMYPNRDVNPAIGTPEYISVLGADFLIYPAPESTGVMNLDLTYVGRPVSMTALTETPELPAVYQEALVRFCLMRTKEQDEDWTVARGIRDEYEALVIDTHHGQQTQSNDHYPVVIDWDGDY